MSLADLTLKQALDGLKTKKFSSVELTQAVLDAVAARDGEIGAYVSFDGEGALAQARAADAAGKGTGVPIAIKDNMNVIGQPCTCSSKILEGYVAPYDATVIAKLRKAGFVFCGRTNMDEFALGSTTESSAFKVTHNPKALDRIPGGSSGGSAAAVGGNLAIAALGSDTGGSIRQPSSHCGCVGLKPTYGRVSRYGIVACASSLDQVGPMTKTVEDAAILMNIISGPDAFDTTALDKPVPDYTQVLTKSVKGMKVGLPKEYFIGGVEADVMKQVMGAVEKLKAQGAEIVEVSLPHTEYAIAVYYVCMTAELSANLARFDGVRYGLRVPADDVLEQYKLSRSAGFGNEVKRRILLGTFVLSSGYYDAYYNRAQKVRTLIRRDFEAAFRKCDILLTPVTPEPAWKLGEFRNDPLKNYLADIFTVSANLAGCCAVSVPGGTTSDGLPVGVQLLGPTFGEELILRGAKAIED